MIKKLFGLDTAKWKKYILIIILLIIIYVIFIFSIGYKIPQFDKHKNWETLDDNQNINFTIEPNVTTVELNFKRIVQFNNTENLLVLGDKKDKNWIINNNGRILYTFDESEKIDIDSLHSRILVSSEISGNRDSLKFHTVNMKTLAREPIKVIVYKIKTIDEFIKTKKSYVNLNKEQQKEYASMYAEAYKAESKLFDSFFPIMGNNESSYSEFSTNYYTDKEGKIYQIRYSNEKGDQYTSFSKSMNIIFENWDEGYKLEEPKPRHPNFFIADTPIITGNEFSLHANSLFSSPTGGEGSLYMDTYQNYLYYYGMKFKNKTFFFKSDAGIEDIYQLNIPKSDSDTLAFTRNRKIYRVYRNT